jgi:phosphoribosylanthranilate isomerase
LRREHGTFSAVSEPKVKICGITNVDDARAAVDAGADALGFMFFERSPRCLSIEAAAEIAGHVPPHVLKVGVFVNPDDELVHNAAVRCQLNLLQFHGDETPEFCAQFGLMTMKAFRIKDADSVALISSYRTDAFLLDSFVAGKHGGTGEKFNWDLAIEAKRFGRPVFLAGGLTSSNVAEAVATVQPFGIDVSSGVESAPGKKDHAKIRAFIAAAKGS